MKRAHNGSLGELTSSGNMLSEFILRDEGKRLLRLYIAIPQLGAKLKLA